MEEEKEEKISFKPNTGMNKSTSGIVSNVVAPSFVVENIPFTGKMNIWEGLKKEIHSMKKDQCLTVTNEQTGMSLLDIQKTLSSIAAKHKRKYIEKDFRTEKINSTTVRLYRTK